MRGHAAGRRSAVSTASWRSMPVRGPYRENWPAFPSGAKHRGGAWLDEQKLMAANFVRCPRDRGESVKGGLPPFTEEDQRMGTRRRAPSARKGVAIPGAKRRASLGRGAWLSLTEFSSCRYLSAPRSRDARWSERDVVHVVLGIHSARSPGVLLPLRLAWPGVCPGSPGWRPVPTFVAATP